MKIGRIDFLNILPIYYYINEYLKDTYIIENHVPAKLNELLATGDIDIGPISSFSYAKHWRDYQILPNLSVTSNGKVRSIFLFSKRPINMLNNSSIALTNTSETSVNLLKVLLKKYYQVNSTFNTVTPNIITMLTNHDAALMIGDDAFLHTHNVTEGLYVYDLGELWKQHTGYTMTFAVWALRDVVASANRDKISEILKAFLHSKIKGLENMDIIIAEAQKKFNFGKTFWQEYYSGLSFDLNLFNIEGLKKFYVDCLECGLLEDAVDVKVWSE